MLTFAFVSLSFVLFAAALAVAFWYVRKDFQAQRRADARRNRERYQALTVRTTALESKSTELAIMLEKVIESAPNKNALQFPVGGSIMSRTENRIIEEQRKEVKVGGLAN